MKRSMLLCLTLAACTHDVAVFDGVDEVKTARDLDVLYVFDNSPDRATLDTAASQLGILTSRLAQVDGQLPSLHVGVVTTDLGTRGTNDAVPAPATGRCSGDGGNAQLVKFGSTITDDFLSDTRGAAGARTKNYSGELVDELAALTNPSGQRTGCEFSQPMEAMRRALDPETNPGFLRRDALLAVVFLTNDDDCSLNTGAMLDPNNASLGPLSFRCASQGMVCDDDINLPGDHQNCRPRTDSNFIVPVSEYVSFLQTVKANRADVIVSAVAGIPAATSTVSAGPVLQPSCTSLTTSAKPAVRIKSLVDSFGGTIADTCGQVDTYQQLSSPIVSRQRSCFPNLRTADGENCRVVEKVGDTETDLDRCVPGSTQPTCWFTYTDAAGCPTGDHLGIAIARDATSTAPATSTIAARCFVE